MEIRLHVCYFGIVVSLFFVATVSTEITCENLNCISNKCTEGGTCVLGCREGYVSNHQGQCFRLCPDNCIACLGDTCADCKSGFYGHQCLKKCDGCKNNSCDGETGKCMIGCQVGYYNEPWCNSTNEMDDGRDHHHHHHQHHHQQLQMTKQDEEQKSRNIYIWTAGTIIGTVIVAIVVVIAFVVRSREKEAKSTYDVAATEHLTAPSDETTEIV